MYMRKLGFGVILSMICILKVFSQDSFSGKYHAANQAQYDSERRWIEITRNQYQEITINGEYYSNAVGYYDSDNQEIFFVIKKPAQYDTFMKIKILKNGTLELYMLAQGHWTKSDYTYRKQPSQLKGKVWTSR